MKLPELKAKIAGFVGYSSVEERKVSDRLLRETLYLRFEEIRKKMSKLLQSAVSPESDEALRNLELVYNDFYRIIHRLRFTSYGNTRFFKEDNIQEEEVRALYRYDFQLLSLLEELERLPEEFGQNIGNFEALLPFIRQALFLIQEFDEVYDRRARLILKRRAI